MAVSSSSCLGGVGVGVGKKQWWLTNKMVAEKYVKDAKFLIETGEKNDVVSGLNLLDAALILSPSYEQALELKARSLLYLRRYKDVVDMLQDYIPSLKFVNNNNDELGFDNLSQQFSREQVVNLLSSSDSRDRDSVFKCFSLSDFKNKIMAGFCKNCDKESQWRYLVLGQATCHLGLLEDAIILLQTGKRLATAALRRESTYWSDDSFSIFPNFPLINQNLTEPETITNLLNHIKLLIRRRTSAVAALDAGLFSESIRHFTKIIESRRGAPQSFLAQCFMNRSTAFRSAGRIADSIADCNRTLSLDPNSIPALETRSLLFESIRCLPDSLHDLEHLKLLYNTILRDRKLPGPIWKRHYNIQYREIPGKLCELTTRNQNLKQRIASGEMGNIDYHNLMGLRRGCSRSELERAYLLLCLRHKPDKALNFIERCEVSDDCCIDSIKDRAKMSALMLYRLLQRGYSSIMITIMEEEAMDKQRKRAEMETKSVNYQGVFCRDLAVVGNLLTQVGFGRTIPVKYEALSC